MIHLYTWDTPNGRKISIMLEELGVPYEVHAVNIEQGEQHDPAFLKLSPNNRIPAIVDDENELVLFESGAILLYLAEKFGRFMPTGDLYWEAMQWLMWQMGGPGPMFGQAHHFSYYNPDLSPPARERYEKETKRLYKVLEGRLEGRDFVVGDALSIVDFAIWPWVSRFERHMVDLNDFPNVKRWYVALAARPAFQKGFMVPSGTDPLPMP
jgi:GST-like protein